MVRVFAPPPAPPPASAPSRVRVRVCVYVRSRSRSPARNSAGRFVFCCRRSPQRPVFFFFLVSGVQLQRSGGLCCVCKRYKHRSVPIRHATVQFAQELAALYAAFGGVYLYLCNGRGLLKPLSAD